MICQYQHKADGSETECDPKYCQTWNDEKQECKEKEPYKYPERKKNDSERCDIQ